MRLQDNSAASQRSRILQRLQSGRTLTTLEARHQLDVMHPGMRVCELRKQGYVIETVWTNDVTPEGNVHRVGKYFLKPRRQLTISDFLSQKQPPEAAATGSGARQNNNPDIDNTLSGRLDQEVSKGGTNDR